MLTKAPGWTAVIGAEATFFDVLVQYWAQGSFPQPASRKIQSYAFIRRTLIVPQ